jgi:hypothetical protein
MLQLQTMEEAAPAESESKSSPDRDPMPDLEPREDVRFEGTLVAASPISRTPAALREIALVTLTQLVQGATKWPKRGDDLASRIGDYRYVVLEFTPTAGRPFYVQMWSEPTANLLVEVGPGSPQDPALRALTAEHASALVGRGLLIGGNAGNYTKQLPLPRDTDNAERIAQELLGFLIDVLGFDGAVDLTYKFQQSTHLRAAHTVGPLPLDTLLEFLSAWGLHAEVSEDDATSIRSRSHGFEFTLHVAFPHKTRAGNFWEIHCHTRVTVPLKKAPEMIADINGKTWLLKAADLGKIDDSHTTVGLAYGINLAGGVTPEHIKSQIFEWLENVQAFRRKAREPAVQPTSSPIPSSPTVH